MTPIPFGMGMGGLLVSWIKGAGLARRREPRRHFVFSQDGVSLAARGTPSMSTPGTNTEQSTYWNDVGGPKWVRYQEMLDRQLDAIGRMVMDVAGVADGETVLDVGCGCGSTSLELAQRVTSHGSVMGVDISKPMLGLARERAQKGQVTNVTFTHADAQTYMFRPEFDLIYSRFGVMFFSDPPAAFANLHQAMKRGGRVAFACWQAIHRNPWLGVPLMAAMKHVTIELPATPDAPGPFAFADAARVKSILGEGGFHDVHVEGRDVTIALGGGTSLDDAAKLVMDLGPLARVMTDASPEERRLVEQEVREAISGWMTPEGVKMPGAIWLVTASA
jgi:SAM-dependent methyltransferase